MKCFLLLLLLGLPQLVLAQRPALPKAPDVPTTMDVAGLRLTLTDEARQLVQQKADGLCRHQPSFQARVDLADASFVLIDRVLQNEGVPLDVRYLALQESALQGDAQSPHGAVGYWQLKRETATGLGLTVNETVDERRHLVASTRAAARYLLRSQVTTQNWLNSLLSYYTGLGGVRPYVLPTDAGATQMTITAQTHPYVLTFLAHKVAFEPACGLNATPVLLLQEFPAVAGQTLDEQAAALATEPALLARHNRWLLNGPVPNDGRAYTLVVPVTDPAQRAALLSQQGAASAGQLIVAPVVNTKNNKMVRVNNLDALIALPGETKEEMARRGQVRLTHFLRVNELTAFDAVVAGRPYFLERKREEAAVEYHIVQPGEAVADISQKYGIQRKAIRRKNHLAGNEELRPGRVLWLRHTRPHDVAVEYRDPAEALGLEQPRGSRPAPRPMPRPQPTRPVAAAPKPTLSPAPVPVATQTAPAPLAAPVAVAAPPAREPEPVDTVGDAVTENLNELPPAPVAAPLPIATAAEAASSSLPPARPLPVPTPVADEPTPAPTTVATAAPATPLPIPAAGSCVVQPGETVYALARRYGLRPADLLAWNSLPPDGSLRVGQQLQLTGPAGASAAPAPNAVPGQHTVAPGDTMFSIARRYGLTVAQLQALNGKADASVKLGEVLVVAQP